MIFIVFAPGLSVVHLTRSSHFGYTCFSQVKQLTFATSSSGFLAHGYVIGSLTQCSNLVMYVGTVSVVVLYLLGPEHAWQYQMES